MSKSEPVRASIKIPNTDFMNQKYKPCMVSQEIVNFLKKDENERL